MLIAEIYINTNQIDTIYIRRIDDFKGIHEVHEYEVFKINNDGSCKDDKKVLFNVQHKYSDGWSVLLEGVLRKINEKEA